LENTIFILKSKSADAAEIIDCKQKIKLIKLAPIKSKVGLTMISQAEKREKKLLMNLWKVCRRFIRSHCTSRSRRSRT
jgi:hypothetical protein